MPIIAVGAVEEELVCGLVERPLEQRPPRLLEVTQLLLVAELTTILKRRMWRIVVGSYEMQSLFH
jgi:hypothetical protein